MRDIILEQFNQNSCFSTVTLMLLWLLKKAIYTSLIDDAVACKYVEYFNHLLLPLISSIILMIFCVCVYIYVVTYLYGTALGMSSLLSSKILSV